MVDIATTSAAAAPVHHRLARPSKWQPFVDLSAGARHRRPADVFTLVVGMVGLALIAVRATDPASWEVDVVDYLLQAPDWLQTALDALLWLGTVWAVLVLAGSALLARRWRLARDLAIAGLVTWGIAWLLGELVDPARSDQLAKLVSEGASPEFPVVSVAVISALVVTATPYLVRPLRRVGTVVVLLSAIAATISAARLPIDVAGAVVLGIAVAAAIHLALGSPEGRPTVDMVVAGAAELGLAIDDATLAPHQPWGEVLVTGVAADGNPVRVKGLGRDADDVRLLNRTWHRIWYRGGPSGASRTGLERVNDEALVTLLAERAGASVPEVLVVGGDAELAVLAERTMVGRSLASFASDDIDDALLDRVWTSVARLHSAGVSHGSLDATNVVVAEDTSIQLSDLSRGRTPAPRGARSTDIAELLTSTALVVGAVRAVAAAHQVLSDDQLAAAVPYLQLPALQPDLRDQVRDHDKAAKAAAKVTAAAAAADAAGTATTPALPPAAPAPTEPSQAAPTGKGDLTLGKPKPSLLGDLRAAVLGATGAPTPEPVKLQRITFRGVAMIALTLFGVYLLMSQFTNIQSSLEEMKGADLWWVAATIIVGQLPEFPSAVAAMGSVNRPIPFGPTVVLEYAEKFVGLVVPSTVGVTAMHARYLTQLGFPVATALTAGVLVSVGGFVVQIMIFIPSLLLTRDELQLGSIDASNVGWLIVLGVVGVGLLITIVWVVPKLRAMIVPRAKQAASDVWDVLRSPSKGLRILTGNLGAQLLYAICLGLALQAYGYSLSLPALLVVNTASSLFAGMMPVPGGIGVAEASLAAGLIAYGVPPSVAGAAALTQRIATFYLPPIWGWVAFRWLSKREFI